MLFLYRGFGLQQANPGVSPPTAGKGCRLPWRRCSRQVDAGCHFFWRSYLAIASSVATCSRAARCTGVRLIFGPRVRRRAADERRHDGGRRVALAELRQLLGIRVRVLRRGLVHAARAGRGDERRGRGVRVPGETVTYFLLLPGGDGTPLPVYFLLRASARSNGTIRN